MKAKTMSKILSKVPEDPYGAFAFFVSRCASGLYSELLEKGKTDTQARLAVIHCFLDFAAGEACRVARSEEREPDSERWRKATNEAFEKAIKRTELPSESETPLGGSTEDRETAIELLRMEQQNGDTEAAHSNADGVLCDLLKALGYADVVEEYEKVDKWFA